MKNLPISSTPGGEGGKLLLLTLLALGSVVLSLCVGSVAVSPGEVLSVLTGGLTEGTSYTIVRFSRLPRTLGCVLAGSQWLTKRMERNQKKKEPRSCHMDLVPSWGYRIILRFLL